MRILLINPSYPFEEFPRLLVTLPVRRLRAARRRPRGRDPRPAARAHDARQDRAAHGALPAAARGHHLGHAQSPHRDGHRGGGAQVRRARCRSPWAGRTSPSRSKARSATCRPSTTSGSARASTRCCELARSLEGRMDLRDVRGLALRDRSDGPHRGRTRRARSRTISTRSRTPRAISCRSRATSPSTATRAWSRAAAAPTSASSARRPQWTGRKVRYRDPASCVDEIEELARLGFTEITIEDDLFTLYRKHFLAVCGELDAPQHGDPLERVLARRHHLARRSSRRWRRPAARRSASASRAATRRSSTWSRRTRTSHKVKEAMRMTQDVGISALASFIIGLPGETEETLRKTVEFAERAAAASSARSTASTSSRPSRAPRCARRPPTTGSRS